MTLVITTGWVLALIIVFSLRGDLPADVRWWVWTCLTGVLMGLFGLWYVPLLKDRRARMAGERERLAETQVSPGYVSRDNGSNTVSSTETPGKSTRS